MRHEILSPAERATLAAITTARYDGEADRRLIGWAEQVRRANQHLDDLLAGAVLLDAFKGRFPLFAIPQPSGRARTGRRAAA